MRDLLYLKNQQALLVNQIRILEPLAKEERISRGGRILSLTKLIGIHERCENRRDLARKLDERIKKLSEEHQTNTSILRSCLNPNCTKKKNSRSRWMLCPSCNRGYCASCSSNMKLATNHAVCTSAPDSESLNSAQSAATNDLELSESDNSLDQSDTDGGVSGTLIDGESDSGDRFLDDLYRPGEPPSEPELPQSTPPSPLPTEGAISLPQTPTDSPNPKRPYQGCGKNRELFICSKGHERCLLCQRYCLSCSRRR